MEEVRKNVLNIEEIKAEISKVNLTDDMKGIKEHDIIKKLFEDNYNTILNYGDNYAFFRDSFPKDGDLYAPAKVSLLNKLFDKVEKDMKNKTENNEAGDPILPGQGGNVLAKAEEKSEQEKSLNAQKPAIQEQQTLEPVNQNTPVMLNVANKEEQEEGSEQEKSTNAQELLQEQNELADAEKPAEQLQFDPSQMISLENEQISLINSCLHALDREVRTLQDENEELLIKNNNQLVVFRLIYNEEQKRMLRLQQTIDGLKKYRENHNIETDEHTQFVNKIKNNYGFGFIQPKNVTQCEAFQSQFIYSDDEERKRKERRELAVTTYKALVDLNKETSRELLQ